jgi:hypothetical protein
MMKAVLIILVIFSLGGGSMALYVSYQSANMLDYFWVPLCIVINSLCAKYLYSKAQSKKTEWALFGFVGNINALFVFWLRSYCTDRWNRGRSVFGGKSDWRH